MENQSLEIIKRAILLEHRGKALYESVVQTSEVEEVKELFKILAAEEEKHIEILNSQFNRAANGDDFDKIELEERMKDTDKILSREIVKAISGAGYEAAVIAAALEFEKKAVEFYSHRSDTAEKLNEKKLYKWLTEWEKGHMAMLADLDKNLREQIWYDNSFWPF